MPPEDSISDELVKKNLVYRKDPVLFTREVLGIELTGYQQRVLMSLVDNMLVAWYAAHGVGKTWLASCAVMWFLLCFYESKVITTASVWRQVEKQLWTEIHKRVNTANLDLLGFSREYMELQNTSLYIRDPANMGSRTWFATGESAAEEGKMEGFHAPHILFVVDEGKLVSREMYHAIMSCLTTEHPRMLVISTPPVSAAPCYFRSICEGRVQGFKVFHTSGLESPYVNEDWVTEVARAGGGKQSALYRAKVLGLFSTTFITDAVYPPDLVDEIFSAELERAAPKVMGVDVARYGDDTTVVAIREGPVLTRMDAWQGKDLRTTSSMVIDIVREEEPDQINVDVIGYGAAVVDNLMSADIEAEGVHFSSSPFDYNRFHNLRAEVYFSLLEQMRDGKVSVLPSENGSLAGEYLTADLLAQTYSYTPKDKVILSPKRKLRSALGRSPDFADAVVLAFMSEEFGIGDGGGFFV